MKRLSIAAALLLSCASAWGSDYHAGGKVDCDLSTAAAGSFAILTGSPAITIYKDGTTTNESTGTTLTTNFNGLAPLTHLNIDTSADATFYASGHTYYAAITNGTVNGVSFVGASFCHFTLDLAGTVTAVSGSVGSVSGTVASVTGNVGGNVVGSVGSIAGVTFPTNFSSLLISSHGNAGIDWSNVQNAGSTVGLSATTVGTLTTYTGNTPQTGDSFARLGAPSGVTIDADILTRLATSGYTAPPTAGSIWDVVLSGHVTAGTTGAALNSESSAVDPWTAVVTNYTSSNTFGNLFRTSATPFNLTIVGPVVLGGDFKIIRGDSYNPSDSGREIAWSPYTTGGWPDLTSATITFTAVSRGPSASISTSGVVVTPTGSQKVRVVLTAAQTSALVPSTYGFSVIATLSNGDIVTLVMGNMTVLGH